MYANLCTHTIQKIWLELLSNEWRFDKDRLKKLSWKNAIYSIQFSWIQ